MASGFAAETPDAVAASPMAAVTATAPGTKLEEILPDANLTSHHHSSPPSVHTKYRQNHNPSKLPAFRFADLKRDSLALPSLLQHQNHDIPPSPVSDQDPADQQPDETRETAPLTAHRHYQQLGNPDNSNKAIVFSPEPAATAVTASLASPESSPGRSRASTVQTPSKVTTYATPLLNPKRSISLDSSAAASKVLIPNSGDVKSPSDSTNTILASQSQHRRAPASHGSNAVETASAQHSTLRSQRLHSTSEDNQSGTPVDDVTGEWAQGQRELLLPKAVQRTNSDDKRFSVSRRPPVSYKPPPVTSINPSGGTTAIPPIRSFRSSGSRRSLVLDMNLRAAPGPEDDYSDSSHRDRTLRALEGRRNSDTLQMTPPDSAIDRPDADDSGDVFLKMAREEPEAQSSVSRVVRSTHRRPLSAAIPSYQPTSPPQITRRLSDQESSRTRAFADDQSSERMARTLTYRGLAREKVSDDAKTKGTSLRPSPLTPRSLTFQDTASDVGSAYSRRRQSVTDSNSTLPSRMSSLKQSGFSAYNHGRMYNSSPLVPKTMDHQKQDSQQGEQHGQEGTESSASTAAASTVWDELDDLKSRIHRLEWTGKLPATSGAAISRASDERPPTATTNATTMSGSPKRGSESAGQQADVMSTTSSFKEGQPLLQSAMNKSKPFLSAEVYGALETAAADAMALSTMIGTVGQPGPISSGASNIGGGANVTDRQLRRKADSICRSLTELCLALSESAAQIKQQQNTAPAPERDPAGSPTVTKLTGMAAHRRPSIAVLERSSASQAASPRTLSRLEERRSSMLMSSGLPSPSTRFSTNLPSTPTEGRKTSLLIPRTRRAGTEEPEEQTGRKSSLLRTRRAGTEEPEEASGRKSSQLLRTRRGTFENEEDESRFRSPSRAVTEVAAARGGPRDYTPQMAMASIEATSLGSSALPRRRLASSTLNTRLVQPSAPTGLSTRRYFDRSTPDRESNSVADKLAEDRGQRQISFAQNSILNRSGSLNKRSNRDSMLMNNTTAAAQGGYR